MDYVRNQERNNGLEHKNNPIKHLKRVQLKLIILKNDKQAMENET